MDGQTPHIVTSRAAYFAAKNCFDTGITTRRTYPCVCEQLVNGVEIVKY